VIEKRLVTNWVVATLEAASGKPVGRGRQPTDGKPPPFYLVYSIDTRMLGAPIADRNEMASLVYQVTSVSGPDPTVEQSTASQDQTEWLADKARTAFLARDPGTGLWVQPFNVAGWSCMGRSLDAEWGGGPGGTPEQEAAIMTYVQRFKFDLTSV
jgi:hypothetical protein